MQKPVLGLAATVVALSAVCIYVVNKHAVEIVLVDGTRSAVVPKLTMLWNAARNDASLASTRRKVESEGLSNLDSSPSRLSSDEQVAGNANYLKWLKAEHPAAVKWTVQYNKMASQSTVLASQSTSQVLFQKLWNVANEDTIGDESPDTQSVNLRYHPRKWLRHQNDIAEMAELHPNRRAR